MKFKNVEELKTHIDTVAKAERVFEQSLMTKFPNLFPKDSDGKPKSPECGVWCPVGWENLVEKLCGAIDWRVKNGMTLKKRKDRFMWVKMFVYNKAIYPIIKFFLNFFDPVPEMRIRKTIPFVEYNQLRDSRPIRKKIYTRIRKIESFLTPRERYDNFPIPPVTIDQIKEKLGGLSFYYSGGDDQIQGMVSFAELLSHTTCELTGGKGKLCIRRGWLKTLCEEKMTELEYSPYKND